MGDKDREIALSATVGSLEAVSAESIQWLANHFSVADLALFFSTKQMHDNEYISRWRQAVAMRPAMVKLKPMLIAANCGVADCFPETMPQLMSFRSAAFKLGETIAQTWGGN